jgi:hypothetical protein
MRTPTTSGSLPVSGDTVDFVDEERNLDRLDSFSYMLVPLIIGAALTLLPGPIAGLVNPDAWAVGNATILFTLAALMAILRYKTMSDESRFFARVGSGLLPAIPGFAVPLVGLTAISYLILMLSAIQPALFALVLLAIKLLEWRSSALATPFVKRALEQVWAANKLPDAARRRKRSLAEWKAEADAIDTYFFRHVWRYLAAAEGVAVGFAAALAILIASNPILVVRHVGLLTATLLIAGAMVGSEIVGAMWRAQRNRDLEAAARGSVRSRGASQYRRNVATTSTVTRPSMQSPILGGRRYAVGGGVVLVAVVSGVAAAFVNSATTTITLAAVIVTIGALVSAAATLGLLRAAAALLDSTHRSFQVLDAETDRLQRQIVESLSVALDASRLNPDRSEVFDG